MPKCVVKTRKLQNHGLFIEYGVNENFSIKVWQMLSLAFLLKDEIPDAFKEMKEIKIFPDNANYFVQCLSGLRIIIHILVNELDPLPTPVTIVILWKLISITVFKNFNQS